MKLLGASADHCEADECGGDGRMSFQVARQPAMMTDPREGALDAPALGQNDKSMAIAKRVECSPSSQGFKFQAGFDRFLSEAARRR